MTHLPTRPVPPDFPLRDPKLSQRTPWGEPPRGLWRRVLAWCRDAAERRRSRQLLAELDATQLRDIGVSRGDALIEARKPFWRL
jgi:uncharacterized protein YjiS (DUF1127 family)